MPEIEYNPATVNKLRYGILCNGYTFKKWQVRVFENLSNSGTAELCLLIINSGTVSKKSIFRKIKSIFESDFIFRMFYRFLFWPSSLDVIDLSKKIINIPYMECKVNRKGKFSEYFSTSDIERIKDYKLDFLLRFGFNIIRGEILHCTPYGVWSYHHGDEMKYRGTPAGFWEIYKNDHVSGAILQCLTGKLDAGIVLRKGFFKTMLHSYSGNTDTLFYGCTHWPAQVCRDILNGTSEYFHTPPSATGAPVMLVPGNMQMIIFTVKLWRNKLRFHFNELFRAEHWNVGIVHKSIAAFCEEPLVEKNIRWMPAQQGSLFRADGFAFKLDEKLLLLYENYNFGKKKGNISSSIYSDKKGFSEENTAIEKEHHLAYPYIFSHNNIYYCIPESSISRKVELYQFNKEQMKFTFHKTLLEKEDAVDPTLVHFKDYWWLFFTRSGPDSNTNLYLYFSENFDGTYLPHSNNPVKTDIRSVRPAGTPFILNNSLFRPSQNSSMTYGGSIVLNKIIKLTPYEFSEETVKEIMPPADSVFSKGIHTICSADGYTIIDAKKHIFVFAAFRSQLSRKIKKVLRVKSHDQ
ncbi:MAG: hypothetical protein V1904_11475 [Bacteroidota bacterium]